MSRLRLHPEHHLVNRIGGRERQCSGPTTASSSTASLIIGVAAAAATQSNVLIAGVAGLVAGAMSMAAGEYVSVSSQSDTERADLARERQELSENPEFELDELADIYVKRGVDRELARQVARQLMVKDALTSHARDELGISEITAARPVQAALTSALSFSVGAAMPLLDGYRLARRRACPDRGGCVPGLSRSSGSNRRMGRRRQRSARHGPGDILGHVGDGSHRRHRKTFRHRCLKIGAGKSYPGMSFDLGPYAEASNDNGASGSRRITIGRQSILRPEQSPRPPPTPTSPRRPRLRGRARVEVRPPQDRPVRLRLSPRRGRCC